MNHDYAHCFDYDKKKCPKTCFRAILTKDLKEHREMYAYREWDWMHLKGTQECERREE